MEMKKIVVLLSYIALGCGIVYFFMQEKNDEQYQDKIHRIAIFQPIIHLAMDDIIGGLVNTLQSSKSGVYATKVFNANGNKILMQAQAQEIVSQGFDAVFAIGTGCSVAIKQACDKRLSLMPIVAVAVDTPETVGLTGMNVTGVIELTDYKKQIDLLLQLKQSIKKVVLAYDISQGSGLEKDAIKVCNLFKDRSIVCQKVEIAALSEIQEKLTGYLAGADIIMILKDNTLVAGLDSLIKLAQQYQIPLLATDLSSGEKGAALAFGIYEQDFGVQGAQLIFKILEQAMVPSQIPFSDVKHMKMMINVQQASLQGLRIHRADFENNSNFILLDVE